MIRRIPETRLTELPREEMSQDQNIIGPASKVTMHFSLALEDGTLVESSFGSSDPLTFTMGDGTLIDGLEYAVIGLKPGDRQSLNIGPDVGFGYRDEDAVQTMNRSDFASDIELKTGNVIEFDSPSGLKVPGTVLEVNDETVKVDFSHPLAGRTVIFNVEILDVDNSETG